MLHLAYLVLLLPGPGILGFKELLRYFEYNCSKHENGECKLSTADKRLLQCFIDDFEILLRRYRRLPPSPERTLALMQLKQQYADSANEPILDYLARHAAEAIQKLIQESPISHAPAAA